MWFQAADPDTKKQITYTIRQGPTDLFSIDPEKGIIRTLQGLDYERDTEHVLIIGTLENNSNKLGATTKVLVNVQVKFSFFHIIFIDKWLFNKYI